MGWTTTDRDALKAAIAKGEKRVRYSDREVEYRSLEEMTQALSMIDAELATTDDRPRQWHAFGRKGT